MKAADVESFTYIENGVRHNEKDLKSQVPKIKADDHIRISKNFKKICKELLSKLF